MAFRPLVEESCLFWDSAGETEIDFGPFCRVHRRLRRALVSVTLSSDEPRHYPRFLVAC
jgi:hypothetical protein